MASSAPSAFNPASLTPVNLNATPVVSLGRYGDASPASSVASESFLDEDELDGIVDEEQKDRIKRLSNHIPSIRHDWQNQSTLQKELTSRLQSGEVECVICADVVGKHAKVWNCDQCFQMLHRKCIVDWFKSKANGAKRMSPSNQVDPSDLMNPF